MLHKDGDAMLQRRRDGWTSRPQQFSATQQDSDALPSTQETPHTRRKHSTDSAYLHVFSHYFYIMPADDTALCSLYMHTIPLPHGMLRINPFSLRLAPLMPCIALVTRWCSWNTDLAFTIYSLTTAVEATALLFVQQHVKSAIDPFRIRLKEFNKS